MFSLKEIALFPRNTEVSSFFKGRFRKLSASGLGLKYFQKNLIAQEIFNNYKQY